MRDNREREVTKRLSLAEGTKAVSEVFDVGLLGLINQDIARVGLARVVAHLGNETGLRHIEVTTTFVDFLASLIRRKRCPFSADHEAAGIFSSESSTNGLVSVMASFIVRTRTK